MSVIMFPHQRRKHNIIFKNLPYLFHNNQKFGLGQQNKRYDSPGMYQNTMKNMYRMATEVDKTCDKILENIKEQGVLNHTLENFTINNKKMHR